MDDLLDLSWSDGQAAAPKQQALRPLSSASSRQPTPNPTFDFLAKPQAGPNYYATPALPSRGKTPSTAPLPQQARLPEPPNRSYTPNPPAASTPATKPDAGDAFSGLFSLAGGSSVASGSKNLSLADRQKQAELERARKAEQERLQFEAEGSFWDNLGSTSTSSRTSTPNSAGPSKSTNAKLGAFDDLLAPQPVRPSALAQSHTPPPPFERNAQRMDSSKGGEKDLWDDDDTFLAGPSKPTIHSGASQPPNDPFDFDAFDQSVNALAPPAQDRNHVGSTSARTPPLDLGGGKDDDDVLGELGRPAKPRMRTLPKPTVGRSSSPPPHIIGQLVEMGFTPQEARFALAQTESGLDVQAALDTLLASRAESSRDNDDSEDEDRVMRERARREEEEAERRRRRRAGPSRDSVAARSREEVRTSKERESEYAEQADKIIAQASEMGQSFLKNATSFWNTSKEKALRAYEEQKRAMEAAQEGKQTRTDGRPRWMAEAEEGERPHESGAFKDSDEDEKVSSRARTSRAPDQGRSKLQQNRQSDLLFENPPRQSASKVNSRSATPMRQATPLPTRSLVAATPSQVESSSAKKVKGNEHFKLGRFSEADSAYTAAIVSLPEGHLHLIPLFNNRAAARLKLGQSAGAIEDCTQVIELVGVGYHPSKEAPLPAVVAQEVKLGEGLVKAVTKRAQAYEMGEKWQMALEDWERVLGFDASLGGGSRGTASEGVRRAKRIIEGTRSEKLPPAQPPKPASTPKPIDIAKSQAVSELRKANQAAEAEDAQRLELREAVDGKVQAWKGGKENNLRALIASLNTVLWPDILSGGLVVGMHELITDKQVKIKYMKVIARLHPDKLNTMSTTVEQCMLANSVFHELNTAWSKLNGGS